MPFVSITDVLKSGNHPVALVDHMEKIPDPHARLALENTSERSTRASIMAEMQGTNRSRKWTDEVSPAMAGKCRRLGKALTDQELQSYHAEVHHLGKASTE